MNTARSKRETFRALLASGPIVTAPGAADVLTARLVESFGFPAVFLSGSLQHKMNGFMDVNVLTLTEMATSATLISEAILTPTIADGESGFGIGVNVARMVRDYERGGVSAIMLEDSEVPKRPSRLGFSSPTVPREIFLDKIKTALDARRDEALVLIARSEIRNDFDELLERLGRAAELGADAFWYPTKDPIKTRQLDTAIGRPGIGTLPSGLTVDEFGARGARCAVISNALAKAALTAQSELLESLLRTGTPDGWFKTETKAQAAIEFFNKQGSKDF